MWLSRMAPASDHDQTILHHSHQGEVKKVCAEHLDLRETITLFTRNYGKRCGNEALSDTTQKSDLNIPLVDRGYKASHGRDCTKART